VKWLNQDATQILSCSADKTVALWDANRGQRLKKYAEHNGIVNSCSIARDKNVLFASASDDCTAIVWDKRNKASIATFYQDYPILSVCLSHDGNAMFTGGIDNIIR
jgi:Prp8 binding protein